MRAGLDILATGAPGALPRAHARGVPTRAYPIRSAGGLGATLVAEPRRLRREPGVTILLIYSRSGRTRGETGPASAYREPLSAHRNAQADDWQARPIAVHLASSGRKEPT